MTADSKITWRSFLNPRIIILLFQGFSSGLPLFLLLNLTQAWLSKSGLNVKTIGLFALMLMPYTWKFLWAPLMDRYKIPTLGRRRGWMAITQLLLFFIIGSMGMLDPHTQIALIAAMTMLLAFVSASQDVVLDAFRREIMSDEEQGLGAAIFVNAYKFAALIPSSISLMLADHMPWQPVFWITGAFMLPGLICTLFIKEPAVYGEAPKSLRDAVVLPFKEFFARSGWREALWILAFILLYKMGDSLAVALSTKCYIDQGFTLTQIGAVGKLAGFWASIVGGIVGGIWMVKLGINRGLWVFGILQALGILGFAWLVKSGTDPVYLGVAVGIDYFVDAGLGTTAFVAFLSRSSDQRYTATQYALFSSLAVIPRTFLNSTAGYIVAAAGWFDFFILCFLLAIPGLLLLPKIAPWNEKAVSK